METRNFKKDQIVHLYDEDGLGGEDPWYSGWDTLAIVISSTRNRLKIKAFENNQVITFINGSGNGMTIAENIKVPTKERLRSVRNIYAKDIKKRNGKIKAINKKYDDFEKKLNHIKQNLKKSF